MGLAPDNDSIEETFLIATLRRTRMIDFYKTIAIIKASIGDQNGAAEALKKYSGYLIPQMGVEEKNREQEMFESFESFKDMKLQMKVGENGKLVMRQEEPCQTD